MLTQHKVIAENGREALLDYFVYTFPLFEDIAVAGVQSQQLIIQADSDFEWCEAVYEFNLGAATAFTFETRPIPNLTVQLTDTGSGRFLSNAPVPVTSYFGRPEMPYVLPITKVFKANATIQAQVTNFDAAVIDFQLRLSLIGWKIFYMN